MSDQYPQRTTMRRARSHSDPSSPPSAPFHAPSSPSRHRPQPSSRSRYRLEDRLPHLTSESSNSSLQSAFSGLTLTGQGATREGREGREGGGRGERYGAGSPTPSVTSVSDDERGPRKWGEAEEEGLKGWIGRGGKGKGRAVEGEGDEEGIAGRLPPEVLTQVLRHLHHPRDLYAAVQVSRLWCLSGFALLWHKPNLTHTHQLSKLTRVLQSTSPSLPYASSIRRMNLSGIAKYLSDYAIDGLELCHRVDRVTLSGAEGISSLALGRFVSGFREASSIDLSGTANVEDLVVKAIAEGCEGIQAVNMAGCKSVGDEGLKAIAERRRMLRRLKIGQCHRVTDAAIIPLARNCNLIIEFDLSHVPQITNASLYNIFTHSAHLRELRIIGNDNLNDQGMPSISDLLDEEEDDVDGLPWYAKLDGKRIIPAFSSMDSLRVVDLTSCVALNDLAVERLVGNAPRIRHLTLAKCPALTDASLDSIGRLGKNLHHLQLGHLTEITDVGVSKLAKHCTRIRYIDLTCCDRLTDSSIIDIAQNLSKLHRIGLVKVRNITDDAIYALVERHATLERMHLSYCDNLSPRAIGHALNRLLRVTHLSLTGIGAFQQHQYQQFCRATPAEYGPAQRETFCVYSGHGITALRNHLNTVFAAPFCTTSDEGSRRDSISSQSSLTLPGTYSPPHPHAPHSTPQQQHQQSHHSIQSSGHPNYSVQYWTHSTQPWTRGSFISSARGSPRVDGGSRRRGHTHEPSEDRRERERDAAPVFRYTARNTPVLGGDDIAQPGIPVNTLVATSPNFFMPQTGSIGWSRPPAPAPNGPRARREGSDDGAPREPRSASRLRDVSTGRSEGGTSANGEVMQNAESALRWTTAPRNMVGQGARAEEAERGGPFGWMASRFGWERRSNGSASGSGNGSGGASGLARPPSGGGGAGR